MTQASVTTDGDVRFTDYSAEEDGLPILAQDPCLWWWFDE
jgi:hypothetical protein